MEKISALIDKLQELKTTGATLQSISYYVQLLQAEILHARSLEREREREIQRRQSHIAVILPGAPLAEPELTVDSNGNITAPQFTPSESKPIAEYKQPEPPAPEPVGIIEPAPIVNQPVAENYQVPVAPEKTPDPPVTYSQSAPEPPVAYQPPAPNIIQPAAEKTPEQTPAPEVLKAYHSPAPTLEALKAYQSPASELDALKAYRSPVAENKPEPSVAVPEQDALKAYRSPVVENKPEPSVAYQPPVIPPAPEAPLAYQPPVTAPAPEPPVATSTPEPAAAFQPPVAEPTPEPTSAPAPKEDNNKPVFIHLFGDANQPVVSAIRPEKTENSEKHEKPDKPETNGIHSELKELNQKVAQNIPSLNDRLRQSQSEIGDRFNDMPVKDLRQAIGINDKFQFIQELFRGDVDSYERSVKTINEMQSIQDAEYWIERELKIRQGWVDDNRAVRQFYALVKKRFS